MHSRYSDGVLSIPNLVDLYGQRGFGAIAITDHVCETRTFLGRAARYLGRSLTEASFSSYLTEIAREAERAWHQYRMLVIPGVEITKNSLVNHKSAHILALGVSDWISPDQDVADICHEIRDQGALSVAAHPIPTGEWEIQTNHLWNRREELSTCLDAWEVGCGRNYFHPVAQSGLPVLANSDLHHPRQMESWKTLIQGERSLPAIFDSIRTQAISVEYYRTADAELSLTSRLRRISPTRQEFALPLRRTLPS